MVIEVIIVTQVDKIEALVGGIWMQGIFHTTDNLFGVELSKKRWWVF